jgi:hypothetical protein
MRYFLFIVLLSIAATGFGFQDQAEIIHLPPPNAVEGNSLSFEAMYSGNPDDILDAKILFRLAGQVGFLEAPMVQGDLKLTGEINGENIGAPGIEYVIVVSLKDGGLIAYPPSSDPLSKPQFVAVDEPGLSDGPSGDSQNIGELIILTPDPGSIFPFGETMIVAVSLFNLDNVDINSVRVTFDNVDVTAYSLVTTDLITYKPDALSAGKHTVFVEVSNIYGVRLASSSWNFNIRSQAQQIFDMKINGSLNLSHRQDVINISESEQDTVVGPDTLFIPVYTPTTQSVSRADFSTNINFDWAKVKIFGNLTSKEDSTLQPQNRYGVKIRTSWLKYAYGDETPMMNRLALWGKRVRGHNIDLRFKWFNLHVVTGQTARAVTGKASFDSTASEWKRTGYSFERGLFAVRPSFGSGKNFQLGFFYVHARDSVNSVRERPGWWDATTFSEVITTELGELAVPFGPDTYMVGDSLQSLNYYLSGANPEDNVVAGSDIEIAFDDHRFVMEGSFAFSLYNRNILDGPLTRSQLDTFGLLQDTTFDDHIGTGSFGELDSEGNKIGIPFSELDSKLSGLSFLLTDGKFDPANLADYFILNENMSLPIDLEASGIGMLPTIAMHFGTKLNYYGNFIHIDYHHVGPGYKALGNPVLRLDGKGWNGWKVTDKIRLLNNMIYLNLGYESYKNNTASQDLIADPRLAQNAFSGGITINPGRGLPTITTNVKFFTRDNNIDDTTHTVQTLASGMDTILVLDNRELNESLSSNVSLTYLLQTGSVKNTFSFNLMRSNMENMVIGKEGLLRSSNLFGLNLNSEWGIPLTTSLSIRQNQNQLFDTGDPNFQTNNFSTYRIGAGYRLFKSKLVLRSSLQYMTFESEKYVEDILTSSLKTQSNLQFNSQYTFRPVTVGTSIVKSRVIGSYENRRYMSDFTDYADNMVSARFEMTF